MHNHCFNKVFFSSYNEAMIKDLKNIFSIGLDKNDIKTVFGQFIPEPDWENFPNENGELPLPGKHFPHQFYFPDGKSDDRWYDWRIMNWDTKWDCYDLNINIDNLPEGFEVTFNTAWSPPYSICDAIREIYPEVNVSWFYDEPGCELAGYL